MKQWEDDAIKEAEAVVRQEKETADKCMSESAQKAQAYTSARDGWAGKKQAIVDAGAEKKKEIDSNDLNARLAASPAPKPENDNEMGV